MQHFMGCTYTLVGINSGRHVDEKGKFDWSEDSAMAIKNVMNFVKNDFTKALQKDLSPK